MLNLLNIHCFIMLEKERNFSKAAQKLFISQQALSNHIKTIEAELGAPLFERTTPLRLTEAGELLLKYCLQLDTLHTQFTNEFNDIRQIRAGHLRIGISFTRGRILLPKILPEYAKSYPQINVSVLEGNRTELGTALTDRKIDLMIGEFLQPQHDLVIQKIYEEELLMLIPKVLIDDSSVMEEIKKTGSLLPAAGYPFLLNKEGNTTRNIADQIFHSQDFSPKIAFEAENMETLFALCKQGMGIMFYPRSFLDCHGKDDSQYFHILPLSQDISHYSIDIAYPSTRYLSLAAKAFIDFCLKISIHTSYY